MKNVYVAGKFQRKGEVIEIYDKLRDIGHTVSYDWTKHDNIKPYSENPDRAREYCENEVEAITESDVFIYLTQDKGTTNKMEYGAALMKAVLQSNITVYAVGEYNTSSPWFFHPKIKRVESPDKAIADLSKGD